VIEKEVKKRREEVKIIDITTIERSRGLD